MIKPVILALQFMTRLPLPTIAAEPREMAQAIRWFPIAGLLVGLAVAGAAWLGWQRDPWAGALMALLAWVGLTGALHLDGLGDIADAAGAAHSDPGRISQVLADAHIGSFGVTAIGLQLLAKLVLLRLALEAPSLAPLIAVPVIARMGPLLWTLILPPLHAGLGSTFGAGADWRSLAAWLLVLAATAWLIAPALIVAPAAMLVWSMWLKRRIGGISGDGHGAGIELVESATLAAWVFWS
jgi:adenosylcobinamide-GDP ribazoletransferase